ADVVHQVLGRVHPRLTIVRKGEQVRPVGVGPRGRIGRGLERVVELETHVGGDESTASQCYGRYDRHRPEKRFLSHPISSEVLSTPSAKARDPFSTIPTDKSSQIDDESVVGQEEDPKSSNPPEWPWLIERSRSVNSIKNEGWTPRDIF